MPKITLELLANKIENLTHEVREGFKGVHRRQDEANGKINQHNKAIINLEKEDIKLKNKVKINKLTWITISFLIAVILGLLGKYVF